MEQPVKEPLELGARHAEVIKSAIKHWVESGSISQDQASLLTDTIVVQSFDWDKFTKYTLRLAVLCLVVAVTSVVFEDGFLKIYRRLVALPPWMRATITCAIALGFHVVAHRRSRRRPEQTYSNEAIHATGAIFLALAAFQLIEQLHHFYEQTSQHQENEGCHPSSKAEFDRLDQQRERKKLLEDSIMGVLFGLTTVYGAIGVLSSSSLIWSCSMTLLGYCFGGMADYASGTYYLRIDSPVLFVGLGLSLIGSAKLMRSAAITSPLWSTTRIWGLLYLFVSLWIMSLFGYDDHLERPNRQKHKSPLLRIFSCSLIFLLAAVTSIWHGLRFDDSTTKGFGLTFLGINLYTKIFEYFWGWYKPFFFSVLAGTLAVLGKYAENVWNMRLPTI